MPEHGVRLSADHPEDRMAAKRRRTSGTADTSMMSNAAEAVGKALGSAVSAIESAVGTRRKRPNGYQKMKARGQEAAAVADRPSRSRTREAASASKPKARARARSTRSRARKAR
jgi:hypothetical protein